jgi:hypothetical protein
MTKGDRMNALAIQFKELTLNPTTIVLVLQVNVKQTLTRVFENMLRMVETLS